MTDKSTHFGKCLRHIRKSENLTLQSFAHKLGISKSFISEVERGEKEPGYKLIKSLKRKYPELNLNYLIAEESALPDQQRLEILEERVNRLFDIMQEKAESYGGSDIVEVPFFPGKTGKTGETLCTGNEETEYLKLPLTLVKYSDSFVFRSMKNFPPQIHQGDILLARKEIALKDQCIVLVLNDNQMMLARASIKNNKTVLTDTNSQEITFQEQDSKKKILGVVYLIIKTVY